MQVEFGRKTAIMDAHRIHRSAHRKGCVGMKQIQVGSTVIARLHDGREVEAKVTKIVDSVVGRTVHIAFGAFALKVADTQIVKVLG